MHIKKWTKDRIRVNHSGRDVRIEGQKNGDINIYVAPDTKFDW